MTDLQRALERIDGRPYPAYRDLEGVWALGEAELAVDHVQGDPYAAPSRITVRVPTGLGALAADRDAREAAEDALLRRFGAALSGRRRGSGRSGALHVFEPGPEVVERSAVRLARDGTVTVRLSVGLPAQGRRILGREAWALFDDDLERAVVALQVPVEALAAPIRSVQNQRRLRRQLTARGLVAFLADGSVLPRASGVSQAPLGDALPLRAPEALAVELDGLDGPVRGLGIPRGITLVVGGAYHGKSTLLQAIQRGHLDHVPGDGREQVVAVPDVVAVRAEDGRSVRGVDISPWLSDLPGGRSTRPFSTDDASGATSQAAALAEALEAGATALLLDEDTSATNLLVRDERMRRLIPREREPITPFVERARQLVDRGVSVVMVVGGVGDALAVADRVVGMVDYVPLDLTAEASSLAGPPPAPPGSFPEPLPRIVTGGIERGRVRARDARSVQIGEATLELGAVAHVLDAAHASTLGHAVRFVGAELAGRSVGAALDALDAILDDEGVEALSPYEAPPGDLIRPRRHEVAAALARWRSLEIRCSG